MTKLSLREKSLGYIPIIIIFSSFLFYAYEDGITGKTLKSSEPGCLCHSETSSSEITVTINGPDELVAGETAAYTIKITGAPLVRGGTNIAASAGILQPGEGLQKISGELTHLFPKQPQNNEVIFEFFYTAPTTSNTITLFANGNSVNFSGTEIGDKWNFAENKTITINTVAGLKDDLESIDFFLDQNFPNPFNPSTSIQYYISKRQFVSLKVYDITAKEIAVLVNEEKEPGIYKVKFDGNEIFPAHPSGVYLYKLQSNNSNYTRKMLLLK